MQPIPSAPTRAAQVYTLIRDNICDCVLEPGKHLVQEELAANLGVSRQPIQQALLLLKNDGLVVELGGRGLYVAPLDVEAVANHYQIRLVMDRLAARLTAENAGRSSGFAARLRRQGDLILAEGEAAKAEGSAPEAVGHDVRFHSFVYEMSGNPLIARASEPHWYFLRRVMIAVLLHAHRGEIVWNQHHLILDALVAGDVETADQLVTTHIEGAHAALLKAMEQRLKA